MSLSASARHDCTTLMLTLGQARGRKLTREDCAACIQLLDDLPEPELRAALEWSARRDRYFPDVPKIRAAAHVTRPASIPFAVGAALSAGEIHCGRCEDTGWSWVDRTTDQVCPRPPAGSHGLYRVQACACRTRNPLYQAKQRTQPRPRLMED